ncbi:hypothetical protein FNV43_RR16534 [Rhamnella rubrinervis]|uniref:Uncharacterized protein n=1 Tax=Rhamnella rubrinervis TaxID=2594499 RepID=A0A8K0GZ07_9ROSA|nr:hypothetical protein FNV43_RR16534 [Rhamnella rubrinervis]
MALERLHDELQAYLRIVRWEDRDIELADSMVQYMADQPDVVNILRSLVEGMKERIKSLKQDLDTLNHLRLQNHILAQAVPVAAVPAAVEAQDLETIRALRDGLVAAYNSLLAQGGQAAAQHLDLAGPGGLNGPLALNIETIEAPVAAQDINIQNLRGWIAALNNMLGGPAAGEDVGDGVRAIARGLDIHALRGLIVAARNQDEQGIDAETLEYLEELVELM